MLNANNKKLSGHEMEMWNYLKADEGVLSERIPYSILPKSSSVSIVSYLWINKESYEIHLLPLFSTRLPAQSLSTKYDMNQHLSNRDLAFRLE